MTVKIKKITKIENIKQWVSWLNNKNNSLFISRPFYRHTIKSQKKFINNKLKSKTSILYKILYKKIFVGIIEADDLNYYHSHCDIGFLISPNFQNKGIAQNSLKLLISILKKKKMRIIYGKCFSTNIASRKIFEKNKFKKIATLKNYYKLKKNKNNYDNQIIYERKL